MNIVSESTGGICGWFYSDSVYEGLVAMSKLGLIMLYFFIADRSHIFMEGSKVMKALFRLFKWYLYLMATYVLINFYYVKELIASFWGPNSQKLIPPNLKMLNLRSIILLKLILWRRTKDSEETNKKSRKLAKITKLVLRNN